jgi:uncharacterized membrane protein (DUF2068 family)
VFQPEKFATTVHGKANLPITNNLETWGWGVLVFGVIMILAGAGIISGRLWARTFGVILASINLLTQMTYMAHNPQWSFAMVLIDAFIIWGLIVHGGVVYTPPAMKTSNI